MPDADIKPVQIQTQPQTDPTAKGTSTSEFKFASAVAGLGAVVSGLTLTFSQLQDIFPSAGWIGVVAGALTTVGAVFSYINGRSKVKVAMLEAGTTVALAQQAKAEVIKANP
jgi:hypothetical protein